MATLQRPPIPQAPLVDPQTGYVTREWWRWFSAIGVVVATQAGDITTVKTELVNVGGADTANMPTDPVDVSGVVRQALELPRLEAPVDLDQAVRQVLELVPPADQVAQDPLPMMLERPAEALQLEQLALLAQVLASPHEDRLPDVYDDRGGQIVTVSFNRSVGGLDATPLSIASGLRVVGPDGSPAAIQISIFDGSAANSSPGVLLARNRGTASVPAAVQTNDSLGYVIAEGAVGSSGIHDTVSGASIGFHASENWSSTAEGALLRLETTTSGTTSRLPRVVVDDDGGVEVYDTGGVGPTGGGKGVGTINVAQGYYLAGVKVLGPTTVVGSLPAAATAGAGARAFVTDATVTTFASVVVGGGANGVPVYSDGTNWRIG
jgi:hypothetical protein